MWTVVYISQSTKTAQKLIDALSQNGIISKLRRARGEAEDKCGCYEVLVPNTELSVAQDLIIENELF